jgi:hypothetical protein
MKQYPWNEETDRTKLVVNRISDRMILKSAQGGFDEQKGDHDSLISSSCYGYHFLCPCSSLEGERWLGHGLGVPEIVRDTAVSRNRVFVLFLLQDVIGIIVILALLWR